MVVVAAPGTFANNRSSARPNPATCGCTALPLRGVFDRDRRRNVNPNYIGAERRNRDKAGLFTPAGSFEQKNKALDG